MHSKVTISESTKIDASPTLWKSVSDDELVQFVKSGFPEAFDELHRRYRKRMLSCATRITKNMEDSEDAVQETFLRAFRWIAGFEGRSSFSAWLTRILINSCLLQLRKQKRSMHVSLDDPLGNIALSEEMIADPSIDTERDYMQKQRRVFLTKAIAELTPNLRTVIQTLHTHDCSLAQIAQLNQLSLAATKSRVLRARAALYNSLSERA